MRFALHGELGLFVQRISWRLIKPASGSGIVGVGVFRIWNKKQALLFFFLFRFFHASPIPYDTYAALSSASRGLYLSQPLQGTSSPILRRLSLHG